jgi:hypothetical protein
MGGAKMIRRGDYVRLKHCPSWGAEVLHVDDALGMACLRSRPPTAVGIWMIAGGGASWVELELLELDQEEEMLA